MQTKQTYNTAIYMRLSKDDDGIKESSSISTQRTMLLTYAKEHDFFIFDEYIDDGFSGTNFDRPAFKRMIQDIEDKKINLVLTKDLSRLGRDYITTGQYTEHYFPAQRVRYIAINDGYDSQSAYTDIAPFKNIINEMYARDTSKKIRSAMLTKMQEGSFIGNFAPYGYKKDPDNKNHLIIDGAVAHVVRTIFDLAMKPMKPMDIAHYLNEQAIASPALYRCMKFPYLNIDTYSKHKQWSASTIRKMLINPVYIGTLAQGKTSKVSFKNVNVIQNHKDDWIIVQHSHEAIVDEESYYLAKKYMQSRTCQKKGDFQNIFSGLVRCMDCGSAMSSVGTRKKGAVANLACGGYKRHGKKICSNHFIDYTALYNCVLDCLQKQLVLSEAEQKQISLDLVKKQQQTSALLSNTEDIIHLQNREKLLDTMIVALYEDRAKEVLDPARFQRMLAKYEAESKDIQVQLEQLQRQLKKPLVQSLEDFYLNAIHAYCDIKTLNKELLCKLIDHIEIGQSYIEIYDTKKIRHQAIRIYVRFRELQ